MTNEAAIPRPALTVIVPVRNGGRVFELCLTALAASQFKDYELLVVDDGSTDDTPQVAERFGARVLRLPHSHGPGGARNRGACIARGDVLVFIDSDVAVHPDTLGRFAEFLARSPETSAVMGSYDDSPTEPALVSTYRNLLHHHRHQKGVFDADGSRAVRTFWTGCGAIRRSVFLNMGGFDEETYRVPCIEDYELGYRLTALGHGARLCRDIQATHMKRWTLRGVIRSDVWNRGVPWIVLMRRRKLRHFDMTLGFDQRLSALGVGASLVGAAVSPLIPEAAWALPGGLLLMVLLNFGFYRFLRRRRGLFYAAAVVPLHALYYVCCLVSVVIGNLKYFNPWARDIGPRGEYTAAELRPLAGSESPPADRPA